MLGPCIILLAVPSAFGASIYAFLRTPDRWLALAALILSTLEAVTLAGAVVTCAVA